MAISGPERPRVPIGAAIRLHAERDPGRPSITHEGRTVTRIDLERRTNQLARAYEQLGVKQHDLVTIALPNGIEFYEACVACWKLGATPQPVSSRLPSRERQALVGLADPPIVVGIEESEHPERICVPPGFEPGPSLSDEPILPDRVGRSWKAPTSGGSTGRPKLIVSGQDGTTLPEAPLGPFGMGLDGVQLVPGPLYHNGPFNFSMQGLFTGNHQVVMSRFEAAAALEMIERHRVQWVLFVPTMMLRIWRLPEDSRSSYDLSSLGGVLHLGAPCPMWLKEAWIEWLGPEKIFELYGGTEAQVFTIISGMEWLKHKGSAGLPTRAGSIKILNEEGEQLPPGEVGEVWLLPPPDRKTYHYIGAEPKVLDGWESLGDMGWLDEDGYLYLADRQADMILVGGANVYPAEVESALEEHPAVLSSAVIGLPDEEYGSRIHAIVHLSGEVTDQELTSHLAERVAKYKMPKTFERVGSPLRDDAGKVRRSALRSERIV